jgi:aspartate/tyrosine/aromatic aminotransferase
MLSLKGGSFSMIETIVRNLIAAITGIYDKNLVLYEYVLNRIEQLFYDNFEHDERTEVINLFAGSYEDSRKKILAIIDNEGAEVAKTARHEVEKRLGHSVVSREKAIDHIKSPEELPFQDDQKLG